MLSFFKNIASITTDYFSTIQVEQILSADKMFRPFKKHQESWFKYFYPHDVLQPERGSWFYLHKYMLPVIQQNASSFHLQGIQKLKLDTHEPPDFDKFKKLFSAESNGFQLEPVKKEIAAKEYFELIKQKKFPCIDKMRPFNELFCAIEPDFWHESIGHIAPLCFKEVQTFYLTIADYILSANNAREFNQHLAVAWTITEYGFIREKNQYKTFGAALVGSHLANMRYLRQLIHLEPALRTAIISSNFYNETTTVPKTAEGKIRFFYLDSFEIDNLFR